MNVKALAVASGVIAAGALATLAMLPSPPASAQYYGVGVAKTPVFRTTTSEVFASSTNAR